MIWYWRLAEAASEQLNNWRLIARGHGISWEDLGEDLSVLGLLEGRRSLKSDLVMPKVSCLVFCNGWLAAILPRLASGWQGSVSSADL